MNCFEGFYILGKTIELFDFRYVKFVEILGFFFYNIGSPGASPSGYMRLLPNMLNLLNQTIR